MKAIAATAVAWLLLLGVTIGRSFDSVRGASAASVTQDKSRSAYPGTLDQHPAIDYRGGALTDVVTGLQRELNAGRASLAFEGPQGFLRAILDS